MKTRCPSRFSGPKCPNTFIVSSVALRPDWLATVNWARSSLPMKKASRRWTKVTTPAATTTSSSTNAGRVHHRRGSVTPSRPGGWASAVAAATGAAPSAGGCPDAGWGALPCADGGRGGAPGVERSRAVSRMLTKSGGQPVRGPDRPAVGDDVRRHAQQALTVDADLDARREERAHLPRSDQVEVLLLGPEVPAE